MADEIIAAEVDRKAREEGAIELAEPPTELAAGSSQSHPLEQAWTLWFDDPAVRTKQAVWGSSLRPIHSFSTAEEFWGFYNNIPPPSKLSAGADYRCFKENIKPVWEDPACVGGGRWTFILPQAKIDVTWLNTILAMIREQFEYGDDICGAVVSIRPRRSKIALWTKNAGNQGVQEKIGRQWKEFLDYNETIGFIPHCHSKRHNHLKASYSV